MSIKSSDSSAMMATVINNRFKIHTSNYIGKGNFGWIYKATDLTNNNEVAVKFERSGEANAANNNSLIEYEYKILSCMAQKNKFGFANVYYFGRLGDYLVLVMDLLSYTLEEFLIQCGGKLPAETVIQVAYQSINRLEALHRASFIHRDIKPENFLFGLGANSKSIFLIDFGLSKQFMHPKTKQHIPFITGKDLSGTPRYASINAHLGYEQSRRDDLEAVCYVLVYLFNGNLPWQGYCSNLSSLAERCRMIGKYKQSHPIEKLCANMPSEIMDMLKYCRELEFEEEPKYDFLKQLMITSLKRIKAAKNPNPSANPSPNLVDGGSSGSQTQGEKTRKEKEKEGEGAGTGNSSSGSDSGTNPNSTGTGSPVMGTTGAKSPVPTTPTLSSHVGASTTNLNTSPRVSSPTTSSSSSTNSLGVTNTNPTSPTIGHSSSSSSKHSPRKSVSPRKIGGGGGRGAGGKTTSPSPTGVVGGSGGGGGSGRQVSNSPKMKEEKDKEKEKEKEKDNSKGVTGGGGGVASARGSSPRGVVSAAGTGAAPAPPPNTSTSTTTSSSSEPAGGGGAGGAGGGGGGGGRGGSAAKHRVTPSFQSTTTPFQFSMKPYAKNTGQASNLMHRHNPHPFSSFNPSSTSPNASSSALPLASSSSSPQQQQLQLQHTTSSVSVVSNTVGSTHTPTEYSFTSTNIVTPPIPVYPSPVITPTSLPISPRIGSATNLNQFNFLPGGGDGGGGGERHASPGYSGGGGGDTGAMSPAPLSSHGHLSPLSQSTNNYHQSGEGGGGSRSGSGDYSLGSKASLEEEQNLKGGTVQAVVKASHQTVLSSSVFPNLTKHHTAQMAGASSSYHNQGQQQEQQQEGGGGGSSLSSSSSPLGLSSSPVLSKPKAVNTSSTMYALTSSSSSPSSSSSSSSSTPSSPRKGKK